mmetsp:Transcript_11836/g.26401  ORF Transcript_11836/g.26401 Transcript_11836/m.26401 type:complete len:168 (+) Transcript_11836:3-506(+)
MASSSHASIAITVAVLAITATCAFAFVPGARSLGKRSANKIASLLSATNSAPRGGMPILPSDVVKYSQVPKKDSYFVKDKIPRGLLKNHTTKAGTYGVIRVNAGKLLYRIEEPEPPTEFVLSPNDPPGIIEPTRLHRVAPLTDDVEFCVEFHRKPGTGPVDEKREGL